ncbi:hypothetical protein DI09_64p80 [Mitosporidium daphniae]|uniref:Uncharacterized protein n=1 Tax=Mitosporidium daphniae TaxID=1485682 RepID=A0A098VNB8_9MICR|nr:uncharacterized protein DI09_64p80 [Mitosporidium daphniae]KGG50572.1 hypothetical protein DI09_64p80 [Mitosporidium daphniae]|eukprot:XP_013237011.1 uncharacterized protein DI09_64p80 [Mitosporidium daphniae]
MFLTDSHIHLKALPISADVSKALLVSIDRSEWDMVCDFAKKSPSCIIPAFGTHPWFVSKVSQREEYLKQLWFYVQSFPNSLLGEIGLDSSKRHLNSFALQEELFFDQFKLANQLRRPISLHVVGEVSVSSLCQFLRAFPLCRPPSISLHSFTGSLTQLRQLRNAFGEDTNVFLGVSQRLSGRLPLAKLHRLILEMPDNRILIESDDEACNQTYISDLESVAGILSNCKNWDLAQSIINTHNNFLEFALCPQ